MQHLDLGIWQYRTKLLRKTIVMKKSLVPNHRLALKRYKASESQGAQKNKFHRIGAIHRSWVHFKGMTMLR